MVSTCMQGIIALGHPPVFRDCLRGLAQPPPRLGQRDLDLGWSVVELEGRFAQPGAHLGAERGELGRCGGACRTCGERREGDRAPW